MKHLKKFNESKKNNIPRISIPEFDYHGPRMRRIEIQEQAAK
jgi:hypothetical protein